MAVTWFLLFVKRLLHRPTFVLLLALIPASLFAVTQLSENINPAQIRVGVACTQNIGMSYEAAKYIVNNEGRVKFVPYNDVENMKQDIRAKNIQWGYVLSDNLQSQIKNGKAARSIVCYETPASFLSKLTDEIVFAAIMRYYGETILMDYANDSGILPDRLIKSAADEIPKAYQKYRDSSDTFSFVYKTIDKNQNTSTVNLPIRGFSAILILIGGIYGGVMCLENNKKGICKRLSPNEKILARLLAVLAPCILLAVPVYAAILLTGVSRGAFYEAVQLLAYSVAVTGFCYMLAMMFKNESTLCGMLPVLVIGSLVFCHVFIDVAVYFPSIKWASWLFLPNYYIKSMPICMIVLGFACTVLGRVLSK